MLILTRMEGESILIGDGIRVTLLGAQGSQVRIGVQAPREVTVIRPIALTSIRVSSLPSILMPRSQKVPRIEYSDVTSEYLS